ncbi:MAG: hypothetical protein Q9225_000091 [Loekoesia sp. 1 TL-2023]
MSGLVGYGSSDDEEGRVTGPVGSSEASISAPYPRISLDAKQAGDGILRTANATNAEEDGVRESAQETEPLQKILVGPEAPTADQLSNDDGSMSPLSPYSANRAATRNLTMPTLPNLDVPPSPPGSPPPGMDEKFERFQQLKKQGMHFNEKLAGSSALKNPMLFQKLMAAAGLSESDQYATTLPEDLWDPLGFPSWAYKEELAKSQQQIAKRKEDEKAQTQRESIEFIPAASAERSINGDSAVSMLRAKGNKASAAERIAADLDEQKMQASDGRFRGELERRNGREVDSHPRPRSGSPRRR